MSMTCVLRYVDVRFLRPKREAFAEALITGEVEVAGQTAVPDKQEAELTKSADVSIRRASTSD